MLDERAEHLFDTKMRQTSLFATGPAEHTPDFSRIRRVALGRGAWIDHGENVLAGADEWLHWLTHDLPWRSMQRPMYDRVVDVPRLIVDFDRPAAFERLETLAEAFDRHYGRRFRSVGCNWYRTGQDSVAWHADRVPDANDAIIAIVGVGERRPFLVRPKEGGPSTRHHVGDGDLIVLGGTFQAHWEHCVPKTNPGPKGTGERVSIMVRG